MGTFEELYRQHVQSVFRFAMSIAGKKEEAEDLTSEAFLALHRNLDSIDASLLPGWLLTVVRNRARDGWRHQVIEERHREALRGRPSATPPALEQWILEDAGLKPVHRACVMLRYVHGHDARRDRCGDRIERDAGERSSSVRAVAAAH